MYRATTSVIEKTKHIFRTEVSAAPVVPVRPVKPVKPAKPSRGRSAASSKSSSTSIFSKASTLVNEKAKAKIWDVLKMIVVAMPPLAAVIYLSVMMMTQVSATLNASNNLTIYMQQAILLNQLVMALQSERAITCVYTTSAEKDELASQLQEYRNSTDSVLALMADSWGVSLQEAARNSTGMHSAAAFQTLLDEYRLGVADTTIVDDCQDSLTFFTPYIEALMYNMARVFYDTDEGDFWGKFAALQMIQNVGETLGLKRTTGGTFYAQGYLPPDLYTNFIETDGATARFLELVQTMDTDVARYINNKLVEIQDIDDIIDSMTDEIIGNYTPVTNQTELSALAMYWFNNITIYSDLLVSSSRDFIRDMLDDSLSAQSGSSYTQLYTAVATVIASLVVCAPVIAYLTVQTNRMNKQIQEKMAELHVEKARSEKLLYSMLPKSIAKSLKVGHVILPKTYSEATVYFSDIKGFTTICSTSSPLEVVTLLNELYTTMDNVLDNYNCYKVETIGDAYMVVSGIPKTNGYDHSMEIATMALHMLKEISAMVVPHRPTERLKMRIGVNSGPCAAGIVGLKMPRYCLFGDTVNTASRMESTGMPMRIQLSESTAAHLVKHFSGQFDVVPRGPMEVKGKGTMNTQWLRCRRGFPFIVDLSGEDPVFPNKQMGFQNL